MWPFFFIRGYFVHLSPHFNFILLKKNALKKHARKKYTMSKHRFLTTETYDEALYTHENCVVTIRMGRVSLSEVFNALAPYGASYNGEKGRVQIHIGNKTTTSISIHEAVTVCTGAKSMPVAIQAVLQMCTLLMLYKKDADQSEQYLSSFLEQAPYFFEDDNDEDEDPLDFCVIKRATLQNEVVTLRTGLPSKLDDILEICKVYSYSTPAITQKLSGADSFHPIVQCQFPTRFPGVILRVSDKDGNESSVTVFCSGSAIGTGSTNPKFIQKVMNFIYNIIKQSYAENTLKDHRHQDMLLQANTVVPLDHTIDFAVLLATAAAASSGECSGSSSPTHGGRTAFAAQEIRRPCSPQKPIAIKNSAEALALPKHVEETNNLIQHLQGRVSSLKMSTGKRSNDDGTRKASKLRISGSLDVLAQMSLYDKK